MANNWDPSIHSAAPLAPAGCVSSTGSPLFSPEGSSPSLQVLLLGLLRDRPTSLREQPPSTL